MISQVGGLDSCRAVKDPRRKAQQMRFKNNASIPSHVKTSGYVTEPQTPKDNAIWTSFSIIMGALIFIGGYIILSASKKI